MLFPRLIVRICIWLLAHTFYRVEVCGGEHLPETGPALLVCNNISFVDPFLIRAGARRSVCVLMPRIFFEAPAVHWLAKRMGAIPVSQPTRRGRQRLLTGLRRTGSAPARWFVYWRKVP